MEPIPYSRALVVAHINIGPAALSPVRASIAITRNAAGNASHNPAAPLTNKNEIPACPRHSRALPIVNGHCRRGLFKVLTLSNLDVVSSILIQIAGDANVKEVDECPAANAAELPYPKHTAYRAYFPTSEPRLMAGPPHDPPP